MPDVKYVLRYRIEGSGFGIQGRGFTHKENALGRFAELTQNPRTVFAELKEITLSLRYERDRGTNAQPE